MNSPIAAHSILVFWLWITGAGAVMFFIIAVAEEDDRKTGIALSLFVVWCVLMSIYLGGRL